MSSSYRSQWVPGDDEVDPATWAGVSMQTIMDLVRPTEDAHWAVFYSLGALEPGNRVEVARADGSTVAFEVYDVRVVPKDDFPTLEVYGNTDGPELRLITCGGPFDRSAGHYEDNVVVFARPAT